MAKKILLLIWCLLATFGASAGECAINLDEVPLEVSKIDPTKPDVPHKHPVCVPSVSLDDHTLYFFTPCDGCTLRLVDEAGVVAYSLVIPKGTASLELPSTLSGNYELQILRGNYCFWGMLNL